MVMSYMGFTGFVMAGSKLESLWETEYAFNTVVHTQTVYLRWICKIDIVPGTGSLMYELIAYSSFYHQSYAIFCNTNGLLLYVCDIIYSTHIKVIAYRE